ncbi:MAG: outer membrane beta-barrel protein [Acidobacteria bacterium]|nr:outer membrane beta-barrel protein [Acidobacteriota bacterium]
MKHALTVIAISTALAAGTAQAQTTTVPPTGEPRAGRYVAGLGGWTFGDKGSQFFGVEGGFAWTPDLDVFVEGGRVRDAAGQGIHDAANIVATGLARIQPGVIVETRQPAVFFGGGLRYRLRLGHSRAEPFLLGGAGFSRVEQDVTFLAGGTDITGTLDQWGVVLGTDLSGSFTAGHIVAGGGLVMPFGRQTFLEVSYRLMRIFAEDEGITANRGGLGFGIRF